LLFNIGPRKGEIEREDRPSAAVWWVTWLWLNGFSFQVGDRWWPQGQSESTKQLQERGLDLDICIHIMHIDICIYVYTE
jgi:hypothetical protein